MSLRVNTTLSKNDIFSKNIYRAFYADRCITTLITSGVLLPTEFKTLIHDYFSCMDNLHVHMYMYLCCLPIRAWAKSVVGISYNVHPLTTNAEGANQHLLHPGLSLQLSQEVYYSTDSC